MERMNFNHLFYFYFVAKEGSIKSAAEKLHVSQPTISDQIKLLEEYLESQLFERKNRSLALTKQGEFTLEYCEKIFELSKELTFRLKHKVRLPKKSIDIGITHYMSQYFLYENILPLFEQDEISVKIRENQRHLLLAELEEEEVDIVFTDTKESISNNMSAFRVGVNRTYVVAHKKFKKLKRNFPDSLALQPFFHYTNESALKFEIDLFFAKNAIGPKIIGEADDIEVLQLITEKAIAFTIVPEVAKNRLCQNKDIVVLGEIEELQTYVWGIIRKDYSGIGEKLLKGKI